mmetsp:Transcript_13464/g.22973  ORF Transcript_13464/g.22973 Transcript_13464/m.22973 type:complete len:130 (+) Transcript_13464:735-1124(+)
MACFDFLNWNDLALVASLVQLGFEKLDFTNHFVAHAYIGSVGTLEWRLGWIEIEEFEEAEVSQFMDGGECCAAVQKEPQLDHFFGAEEGAHGCYLSSCTRFVLAMRGSGFFVCVQSIRNIDFVIWIWKG